MRHGTGYVSFPRFSVTFLIRFCKSTNLFSLGLIHVLRIFIVCWLKNAVVVEKCYKKPHFAAVLYDKAVNF